MMKFANMKVMLAMMLVITSLALTSAHAFTWRAVPLDTAAATEAAFGTAAFTNNGPLRAQMHGSAAVTVGGRTFLYLIGGNAQPGYGDSRFIFYAEVVNGTVGAWQKATFEFPNNNAVYICRSAFGYNGRLYVVGGRFNTTEVPAQTQYNGVRVFAPTADGDITGFYQEYDATGSDPILNRLEMATALHPASNSLFIVGGTGATIVQRLVIDPVTGLVSGNPSNSNLPFNAGPLGVSSTTRNFANAVVLGDTLYIIGGNPVASVGTLVESAPINPDGTLGTFVAGAPLPEGLFDGGAAVFQGNIYVIGGTAGGNADTRNTVFRAELSGSNITGWATASPLPLTIRRVGAVATPEAVYVISGRVINNDFSDQILIGTVEKSVETFEGFDVSNSTVAVSGASSLPGGALSTNFGPPYMEVVDNNAAVLPVGGSKFISLTGETDEELIINHNALIGTEDVVYLAMAVRVNSLSASVADQFLDLLRVRDSAGNLYGIVLRNGVLRLAGTNGWNPTNNVTAIFTNDVSTLGIGDWRVLIARLDQSTPTNASAKLWIMNGASGVATLSADVGGFNVFKGAPTQLRLGATFAFPNASRAGTSVSIDHITFYNASTITSEEDFLSRVRLDYTGIVFLSAEPSWTLFE